MSRCFAFPPPGYVLNRNRDGEAVIESIKGAEEKAKKEQRKKEKRREKKEKREKKKEKKRKEREGKEGGSEKRSHKRRRKEEEVVPKDDDQKKKDDDKKKKKDDVFSKLKDSEVESLEKSSLTVERELLQSTSQNSCDSTVNSNNELPKQKEKEKQQPLDVRNNSDSEGIFRIRLPIRRQKDPEVVTTMIPNKDQQKPCPSQVTKLGSSQGVTREKPVNQHPCSTSAPEHASKPCEVKRKDKETKKLGKEKKRSSFSIPDTTYQPSSLCSICPPSLAVQFLSVVENWVPNTTETRAEPLTNSENDWWLSKKPSNHKFGTERCKQVNNETKEVSCSIMAWPCARLLPEADIHALPYTIPF
ncbi:unnamed protein product [Cochlearia groenlandica]